MGNEAKTRRGPHGRAASSWMRYAAVAVAYRCASTVYGVDEEMQQLGTAAVHLLTMPTSYIAAQSAEITPRSLGCSFLSPTAVSGKFGNSGATSCLRMEGMYPNLSERVSEAGQHLAPERWGLVCRVRDA